MRDRFRQWFSGDCSFLRNQMFDINDANHREIVAWLFALYSDFLLFLKKHDREIRHRVIANQLNSYIKEALENKWTIQQVKPYITDIIDDNWDNLFNTTDLKQDNDKAALKELVKKTNPENLNAEDFDYRINLNLSSTQDYYQAKKTFMRECNQHARDKNMDQEITENILADLVNKNKKYKFYLSLQDKAAVQKLMNDVKKEVNNNINMIVNLQINKIIHAICIASTSRGTSPALGRQIDFWNLGNEWARKAKKSKYSSFNNGFKSNQEYGGADYIKKGLEYIKIKINSVNDLNTLSVLLVQKIKNETSDISHLDPDNVAQNLLYQIKNVILYSKKNEKNVRTIALLSVMDGYIDLCEKLKLDEPSEKIIELLVMRELHQLITQELVTAIQEKQVELIYRSCIDLMSVMITLRLSSKDNQ